MCIEEILPQPPRMRSFKLYAGNPFKINTYRLARKSFKAKPFKSCRMRSCKRVLRKAFRMRSYRKQAVGGGTFSQPTVKFCRSHLVPVFEIFSASNFQLGCPTGCLLRATSAPQSFVPPNKPPG